LKNWKLPETIKPTAPPRPPHELALEQLALLSAQKLWQNGKTKAYYSELTNILREYIEARFGVTAMEQTTEEIIMAMKRLPDFDTEKINAIRRVLFLADLVKFAK